MRVSGVLLGVATAGALAAGSVAASATSTSAVAPAADGLSMAGHATTRGLPMFVFGSYRGRRPRDIYFSGDSGNIVVTLRWSSWTSSHATGAGRSLMQGCVPDCATGAEIMVPTTVTLRDPVDGYFTRIIERRDGQDDIWVYKPRHARGSWPLALHAPVPNGPVISLEYYWGDIDTGAYAKAWTYLSRPGETETAFIEAEKEARPANIELLGTLTGISGIHATIKVDRLITHDDQYGCRSWSGIYDLVRTDGHWLIASARIAPKAC